MISRLLDRVSSASTTFAQCFGAHFSLGARKMIDDQKPMPYTGNMLKYSNKKQQQQRLPQTVGSRGAPADLCANLTQTCEGLALKS